jgi:hypothetical protein
MLERRAETKTWMAGTSAAIKAFKPHIRSTRSIISSRGTAIELLLTILTTEDAV